MVSFCRSWEWCTWHKWGCPNGVHGASGGVARGLYQQRLPRAQQRRRTVAEQRREVRPAALRLLQPQRLDRGGVAGGCCRPVACARHSGMRWLTMHLAGCRLNALMRSSGHCCQEPRCSRTVQRSGTQEWHSHTCCKCIIASSLELRRLARQRRCICCRAGLLSSRCSAGPGLAV